MSMIENEPEQKAIQDQFEEKLIAKIKNEKLSPKPRWQFLLKDYVVWISGALALIIGAVAVSVMIYLLKYNDWDIYSQTKKSFWEFFILTLPYFWFIFLGIFIFIVYYNFKHTENGYRYPRILLVGASILLSVLLGTVFFTAGIGEKLDDILGRQAPFYDRVFNPHIDFWSQPAEGRLSGMVIFQNNQTEFLLVDRDEDEWLIEVENAKSPSNEKIIVGQPINLLGEEIGQNVFKVDEILPVRAGRGFLRRFNGPANGQKVPMMPSGANNIQEGRPIIIIEDTSTPF
jgi:heme/copper-type cytochrome/quinol oxidase subunit 2